MKRLIITADDYGMSPSVNKAIDAGVAAGVITSTNLMPGMEYTEDAATLRKKHPNISIGIHWTLTAGKPVSKEHEVGSLIDDTGHFWSYNEFRKRYRKGFIKEQEIRHELIKQYYKFCLICGEPDYWNTHQNVHVGFKIFDLFLSIAKDLEIKKMRTHQRIYIPAKLKSTLGVKARVLEPFKIIVLNQWMNKAKEIGIKAPDGMLVHKHEDDKLDMEYVLKNIQWNNKNTAELIIHPAMSNDSLHFGRITDQRIREFELFTDNNLKILIMGAGITLITYEELN